LAEHDRSHGVNAQRLARLHGTANVLGGLWPLVHLRSFEAVFGPKADRWLVKTVSGLLLVNGVVQLSGVATEATLRQSRRLGVGTAAVLLCIDLIYVPTGRISPVYLLDALVEIGWIALWARSEFPQSRG
jgi:hypothetical protein